MTTYFVRKTGLDANSGLSKTLAFLTLAKAVSMVAAGDTVHVGAGTYREMMTLATSGSSGSSISWYADVLGTMTDDPGQVIISSTNAILGITQIDYCISLNEKTFNKFYYFTFDGGEVACIGQTTPLAVLALEGIEFYACVIWSGDASTDFAFDVNVLEGVTPATTGLIVDSCSVIGKIRIRSNGNNVAHINLKWTIKNCVFLSHIVTTDEIIEISGTTAFTFSIGGITVQNNTFLSNGYILTGTFMKNTTNPVLLYNNLVLSSGLFAVVSSSTVGATLEDYNYVWSTSGISPNSNVAMGQNSIFSGFAPLIGGFADIMFYKLLGWSPYKPFEPIAPNPVIAVANPTYVPTTDLYNRPRNGRDAGGIIYYFDGSDAAVTDPNNVWTTESNITDNDRATDSSSSTNGTTASNFVKAEGTNAPASGATIQAVYARVWGKVVAGVIGEVIIYTDGLAQALGTINWTHITPTAPTDWVLLSTPTGGWDWTKAGALEFKGYRVSGASNCVIARIEIAVKTDVMGDIGAVESRVHPTREATIVRTGTYSAKFSGVGYYEKFVPVNAQSTTISVYARYDSNYVGSKPKLEVFNISGVADQAVSQVGAANAWELLTLTFTPSTQGLVRVRLSSLDISITGISYFDDLTVT